MASGFKTGGRQKGTPNKRTTVQRELAAAGGIMPLDYMLKVMRDGKADKSRRDDMARAAAPYLHARLSAIEHAGDRPADYEPLEERVKRWTEEQHAQGQINVVALPGQMSTAGTPKG